MNERVQKRFQRAAAGVLEEGETVELALLTHSGPMFYDPLLSVINLVNVLRGRTQGRALIATDRRVLYTRSGTLGSIGEVIGSWKLGSAPIELELGSARVNITVDGERSSCRGPRDTAVALVATATGAEAPH
jgi:hypothetical protein